VGELSGFLAVAGGLAAILGALVLLARRVRRRGVGGAIMGPFDEIYHPAAHRFRFEIQVRAQRRMVPLPSPADRLRSGRSDSGTGGYG
jgi:hypothetical protein